MKITMRPLQVLLAILFSGILLPSCKTAVPTTSIWVERDISVDGRGEEWEHLPRLVMQKQDVVVGLANDADYLYLMLRMRNPRWAHAIASRGLTLWFDTTAGKTRKLGLRYHSTRLAAFEPSGGREPTPRADQTAALDALPGSQLARIAVLRGPKDEGTLVLSGASSGIVAEASAENDGFTYEFAIPLRRTETTFGLDVLPGQRLSVGAEFGPLGGDFGPRGKRPEGGMGPPGGGGFPPTGGRPGRGGPGGRRPPETAEGMTSDKAQEIWLRITLAQSVTPAP